MIYAVSAMMALGALVLIGAGVYHFYGPTLLPKLKAWWAARSAPKQTAFTFHEPTLQSAPPPAPAATGTVAPPPVIQAIELEALAEQLLTAAQKLRDAVIASQ